MDNNNGAVWCRHMMCLLLKLKLILFLLLRFALSEWCRHKNIKGLVLALDIAEVLFLIFVQGLVLDFLDG